MLRNPITAMNSKVDYICNLVVSLISEKNIFFSFSSAETMTFY